MTNKFLHLTQCLDNGVNKDISIRIDNVVDFERCRDGNSEFRTRILLDYRRDGDHTVNSIIFVTQEYAEVKLLIELGD